METECFNTRRQSLKKVIRDRSTCFLDMHVLQSKECSHLRRHDQLRWQSMNPNGSAFHSCVLPAHHSQKSLCMTHELLYFCNTPCRNRAELCLGDKVHVHPHVTARPPCELPPIHLPSPRSSSNCRHIQGRTSASIPHLQCFIAWVRPEMPDTNAWRSAVGSGRTTCGHRHVRLTSL